MSTHQPVYICLFVLLSAALFHLSHGDIGTAAVYSPPYLPTACNGNDQSQFPPGNFFAAAGEGIWDAGASCGRQYRVRCISATVAAACIPGTIIQVKIVDRAFTARSRPTKADATLVLSTAAFAAITNSSVAPRSINIEYSQV